MTGLGPGAGSLAQTGHHQRPDYLISRRGVDYTTDWVIDDHRPAPSRLDGQHAVNAVFHPVFSRAIPYSVETNDVVMSAIQQQPSSEIYDRIMDQFECFYEEGEEHPRILSVCSHPYLSGVPHRIKYFRKIYEELKDKPGVLFWTGDQIIDWYKEQTGN